MQEGDTHSFDVLLLPQRTGHLLLPSVSIHPNLPRPPSRDEGEATAAADSLISCETDYVNQAESVLVVPDLSSTTVSHDLGGSAGGAWCIESQSRNGQAHVD